jgi:putative transcriptional regulator
VPVARHAWLATLLLSGFALASAVGPLRDAHAQAQPRGGPERDPKKLRPGVFLYAVPGLGDPSFAETVVLLVAYDKAGAMGLVVNRPTRVPLRELLKNEPEAQKSELHFYWGGPVQPEAVHALVRTSSPSESAQRVLGDVCITGDVGDVRAALARLDASARVKLFTGYAGWTAGQLEIEVRAGAWVLEPADARSVFTDDPDLWQRVHEILERLVAWNGDEALATDASV